jgi:transmembrane 9 superfamily protein 2/4
MLTQLTLNNIFTILVFYLNGFYDDGWQGDPLRVKVNKLSSTKTQLPYSYYSLPYCRPDHIIDSAENLGEVLRGDRIENSPYMVGAHDFPFILTFS